MKSSFDLKNKGPKIAGYARGMMVVVVMAAFLVLGASGKVLAVCIDDDLLITGISPTPPIQVENFSATVQLVVSLQSISNLDSLSPFIVKLNDVEVSHVVYVSTSEPPKTGTLTFSITVSEQGNYTLEVIGKKGRDEYCDEEAFAIALVSIEYKAPPAIANEYINSLGVKLNGKVRGCIISTIAQRHGKEEAYGPKGGPYCEKGFEDVCISQTASVHGHVEELMVSCN